MKLVLRLEQEYKRYLGKWLFYAYIAQFKNDYNLISVVHVHVRVQENIHINVIVINYGNNSSNMSLVEELKSIWVNTGGVNIETKVPEVYLETTSVIPAQGKPFNLLFYGKSCGPGYSNNVDGPIDCLDLTCMLHDRFYETTPTVDQCFQQSIKLFQNKGLIRTSEANDYCNLIETPLFATGSFCWKNRIALILIVVGVITMSTSGILLLFTGVRKKKKL